LDGQVILITGGAVFIGCSLANRFALNNCNLTIVDRLSDYYSVDYKKLRLNSELEKINYFFLETDINQDRISELFLVNKFDTVVHLAAQPGVRVKFPQSMNYLKDNISGFSKTIEPSSLILISSSWVKRRTAPPDPDPLQFTSPASQGAPCAPVTVHQAPRCARRTLPGRLPNQRKGPCPGTRRC
jgi:hypothetical protein